MSTSSLNPKLLKGALTSIRAAVGEVNEDPSHGNISKSFVLLLVSELASRGAGVDLPSSYDDNDWIRTLLESISTVAGKVAIDDAGKKGEGNYPLPMMGALSAASGMAASAVAASIQRSSSDADVVTLLPLRDKAVKEACQSTIKRCIDVNEGRLYTLLKLASGCLREALDVDSQESTSDSKKRQRRGLFNQNLAMTFHTLAYSNFLYGASNFVMDQPPMWKRCLDSALEQSSSAGAQGTNYRAYQNPQCTLPLQNLIRIAKGKGNAKRVKELSLYLCTGYLGAVQERLERIKSSTSSSTAESEDKKSKTLDQQTSEELMRAHFLHRTNAYVDFEELSTFDSLLESATTALSECDVPDSINGGNYEAALLYYYAQVQLGCMAEESDVWIEVLQMHRAMINRKPESTSGIGTKSISSKKASTKKAVVAPVASTKEEMERLTRTKVYLGVYSKLDESNDALLSPVSLRDAVCRLMAVEELESFSCVSTDILRDCHALLLHQVKRLGEIGIVVQKKKGAKANDIGRVWRRALSFVSPLVENYLKVVLSEGADFVSLHKSLRSLAEECCELVVASCWMCESIDVDFNNEVSTLLHLVNSCLSTCKQARAIDDKRRLEEMKRDESVVSSKDSVSSADRKDSLLFQCTLAASKCRADIECALSEHATDQEKLIDALTASARRATAATSTLMKVGSELRSSALGLSSASSKFGCSYLQFLSAWAGLCLSPWLFCTLGQARTILNSARESISSGRRNWGRHPPSLVESILLDLGEADLEGGLLGGFRSASEKLYRKVLIAVEEITNEYIGGMLRVHCLLGLARLAIASEPSDGSSAEELARDALESLESLGPSCADERSASLCVYPWRSQVLNGLVHSYHVCASRQLVAEACVRSSRPDDALEFLTEAVKDFPGNFEAALALASFNLRTVLDGTSENDNSTRTLLLKSAKMGKTKADPFALLGIWYERKGDSARARGCYQKALILNPSHPVAGRGLSRLMKISEIQHICEVAADRSSAVNGWAWRILGEYKISGDGDDTAAIVCFQQALRCKDIQAPQSDSLGVFYSDPKDMLEGESEEASRTWSALAMSYRRLGKYSAALRGYEAALASSSSGELSPDVFCGWAQVELDLGMYDEAAQKCSRVLMSLDAPRKIKRLAAYIQGESLLCLARVNIQQGKFGACFEHLNAGITMIAAQEKEGFRYCEAKLLGDLYSFAESIPCYVFDSSSEEKEGQLSSQILRKVDFIAKGESAYTTAMRLSQDQNDPEDEDAAYLVSAAATDLGTNLLAQARVICAALGEGSGGGPKASLAEISAESSLIKDLLARSINAYMAAVSARPEEAPAWCGLGCALLAVDPMLSQHSFCRAIEIDPSLADSWSNVSLLYANVNSEYCSETLDRLTSIEDTPLMWIGRGFLLEKTSRAWKEEGLAKESCLAKAADAYRAALQIGQDPAALLGLSLTCRRSGYDASGADAAYSAMAFETSKTESKTSISVHQHLTGGGNIGACLVHGLLQVEDGLSRPAGSEVAASMLADGSRTLAEAKERQSALMSELLPQKSVTESEIDIEAKATLIRSESEAFPSNSIARVAEKIATVDISAEREAGHTMSLRDARNAVCLNPDSGEVWLAFAHKLCAELADDPSPTDRECALVASLKARDLLYDRVVNATLVTPRRKATQGKSIEYSEKSVVSSLPHASLLSESLALIAWLDRTSEEKARESSALVSLQESLMIDPVNALALTTLSGNE